MLRAQSRVQLLPFQTKAKEDIKEAFKTYRSVLLQSATGSGKTIIGTAYIQECLEDPNEKVLFLVNLQVLVSQSYKTGKIFGITYDVLHDELTEDLDGNKYGDCRWKNQCVISLPRTFVNTIEGDNETNDLYYDPSWRPTLIVIDEAHKGTSECYQRIRAMFPEARILGMTATPYRQQNEEGEKLTDWYKTMVSTVPVEELIQMGRLVRPEYLEFDETYNVVKEYQKITAGRENKQAIVFVETFPQGRALEAAFRAEGINAIQVTAGNKENDVSPQTADERQKIYNDFNNHQVKVLISIKALCEGFDSESATYCFLVGPIGNVALYHQMIGRVLRSSQDKTMAFILDFCGNFAKHGRIEEYQWSLDYQVPETCHLGTERTIGVDEWHRNKKVFIRCADCNHVFDMKVSDSCSHCGRETKVKRTGSLRSYLRQFPVIEESEKKWTSWCAKHKLAFREDSPDKYRPTVCEWVNRSLGMQIFEFKEEKWTLRPEFEFLRDPVVNSRPLKWKISY